MKGKLLNLGVVVTSLFGYLEWGTNNRMFLFQGEAEIISKLFTAPHAVLHPFTLLPLLGQIMLIGTLFQKRPGRLPSLIGLGCIGMLLVFMFAVGLMSANFKILISTLPFLATGYAVIRHVRTPSGDKPR